MYSDVGCAYICSGFIPFAVIVHTGNNCACRYCTRSVAPPTPPQPKCIIIVRQSSNIYTTHSRLYPLFVWKMEVVIIWRTWRSVYTIFNYMYEHSLYYDDVKHFTIMSHYRMKTALSILYNGVI